MRISPVSFCSKENISDADREKRKKRVGEAAVGTSAVAAAGNKSGFKMFNSTRKAGYLSQEVVDNIKLAQKPVKQTKSLFGKFSKMAKAFSGWITDTVSKTPVLSRFVKSRLFVGAASTLGFGLAVLTLATGLTNIAHASTTAYSNHIEKSKFFNSFDDEKKDDIN